MPAGLKATSSPITISQKLTTSAANAFTQEQVSLPLNTLDREVFVILAIDMDVTAPDMDAALNTSVRSSVTTTSQTTVQTIGTNGCLSAKKRDIRRDAVAAVAFENYSGDSPHGDVEFLAIIATDDFFLQIDGENNTLNKTLSVRLWGYRATVTDAGIYASLVQSELLS